MGKQNYSANFVTTLALAAATVVGTGFIGSAAAQNEPSQQAPDQTQPSPQQQPDRRRAPDPSQQTPPDAQDQQQQAGQTFSGTITKQGDKYVLQDEGSGTTYDVDHQAEVKKFEGKKVRIHGTLDPNGKLIHIQ
jgi:uncharacterized protein YdeI (BOF family)